MPTGVMIQRSVTITEPAVLVAATVVDSNVSCNGLSDGGASASATGWYDALYLLMV